MNVKLHCKHMDLLLTCADSSNVNELFYYMRSVQEEYVQYCTNIYKNKKVKTNNPVISKGIISRCAISFKGLGFIVHNDLNATVFFIDEMTIDE